MQGNKYAPGNPDAVLWDMFEDYVYRPMREQAATHGALFFLGLIVVAYITYYFISKLQALPLRAPLRKHQAVRTPDEQAAWEEERRLARERQQANMKPLEEYAKQRKNQKLAQKLEEKTKVAGLTQEGVGNRLGDGTEPPAPPRGPGTGGGGGGGTRRRPLERPAGFGYQQPGSSGGYRPSARIPPGGGGGG